MKIFKLILSIIACQSAGLIGSIFTRSSKDWYEMLNKPFFTPPDWVFAPVWISLYTIIGIAVFIIWQKGIQAPGVKKALIIFIIQLVLNAFWPIAFFGSKSINAGMLAIVVLWLVVLKMSVNFSGISKIASFLLVPYILWISFALVLNAAIVVLN